MYVNVLEIPMLPVKNPCHSYVSYHSSKCKKKKKKKKNKEACVSNMCKAPFPPFPPGLINYVYGYVCMHVCLFHNVMESLYIHTVILR